MVDSTSTRLRHSYEQLCGFSTCIRAGVPFRAGKPGPRRFTASTVSTPCRCCFDLTLSRCSDRNLPPLPVCFRHRNADFQHSILEVGLSLIDLCTLRQRDQAIEPPIHPLGAMPAALVTGMLLLSLSFKD